MVVQNGCRTSLMLPQTTLTEFHNPKMCGKFYEQFSVNAPQKMLLE